VEPDGLTRHPWPSRGGADREFYSLRPTAFSRSVVRALRRSIRSADAPKPDPVSPVSLCTSPLMSRRVDGCSHSWKAGKTYAACTAASVTACRSNLKTCMRHIHRPRIAGCPSPGSVTADRGAPCPSMDNPPLNARWRLNHIHLRLPICLLNRVNLASSRWRFFMRWILNSSAIGIYDRRLPLHYAVHRQGRSFMSRSEPRLSVAHAIADLTPESTKLEVCRVPRS